MNKYLKINTFNIYYCMWVFKLTLGPNTAELISRVFEIALCFRQQKQVRKEIIKIKKKI